MGKVTCGLILILALLGAVCRVSAQGQGQCPRLQKPWNGQFVGGCNLNIGSQCIFQCREPYILVGSRVRMCKSDGTWSGQTSSCQLDGCADCGDSSNCGNVYNPDNGYTEGQCTPGIAGQNCFFHCNHGYSLEGESQITCYNGGQWSARAPFCRGRSAAVCQEVNVQNGNVQCGQEGGMAVCRVICDQGYMIVGSSVVTCSSNGYWNEMVPTCRRFGEVESVCPTLVAPDGGRLVGSCTSAGTGDTCQLVCLSGYRPTDTRILICQGSGRWTDSLPRCVGETVNCPTISVSQGSTTESCAAATVGQICTITCNSGYALTGGSGTLICQSNGQWSGSIPTCTARTCPTLAAPVYGGTSGTCSPGQVGQTCNFFCNSGYQLVGQPILICGNDGRWSGNAPYCTGNTCPSLDTPANGARSGSCTQATVGQSCSFSCQSGYTLNGQSTLYCQAGGMWSSAAPMCTRVSCPALNAPNNGMTSGSCSQATVGQSCTFSCQSGYTLNGQQTLYCQAGGSWSTGTPSCIRNTPTSCANLFTPNNGYMQGTCAPGRVGEICVFGCNDGYTLNGQMTLTCTTSGQWSNNTPRCEISDAGGGNCPVLTPPPNGAFEVCNNQPGGQCIVTCASGYVRSGSRVRTCLGQGTWSGYAPTCTRTVGIAVVDDPVNRNTPVIILIVLNPSSEIESERSVSQSGSENVIPNTEDETYNAAGNP